MDKILLVDDETDVQYSFRRIFEGAEVDIHTAASGEDTLRILPEFQPDLVIMDIRLGGMNGLETLRLIRRRFARLPVLMMTAFGTTQTAIEAMKLGAFDYLLKPFDVLRLKQIVSKALEASHAMRQVVSCLPDLESDDGDIGIVGRSAAMQEVFKLVGQLSDSETTVLITGESGTGKELAARAIYHHSPRSQETFLAINCAAIPETLLESELFGHERGAFTNASFQRIGKFEQCHRGTLFLDEIGDMSPATQTKILRILQSGTFERVGGNQTLRADVRILAATNKDLEQAVAAGQFREDLFYRLNVVRIHMPPLRARLEDIPMLVHYFLRKYGQQRKQKVKAISPEAIQALERYHWPGNVRELENAIQRALVMSKGEAILRGDLPDQLQAPTQPKAPEAPGVAATTSSTSEDVAQAQDPTIPQLAQHLFRLARSNRDFKILPAVERELIIQALQEAKGNQAQAARLLGITRATLRKRVEKFGIARRFTAE